MHYALCIKKPRRFLCIYLSVMIWRCGRSRLLAYSIWTTPPPPAGGEGRTGGALRRFAQVFHFDHGIRLEQSASDTLRHRYIGKTIEIMQKVQITTSLRAYRTSFQPPRHCEPQQGAWQTVITKRRTDDFCLSLNLFTKSGSMYE